MKTRDALFGLCVGDALGVPAEFMSRDSLTQNPVQDMVGFGSHHQPAGTWSDDSSLAFCLAESLCKGYDLKDIAQKCLKWYKAELWTPHGKVFDIGIATSKALHRIAQGVDALTSGGVGESDNGNGSLMRILPLVFYLVGKPIEERYRIVAEVSGITHAHVRSILACFIYCEYALLLLAGKDNWEAYLQMQKTVNQFLIDYQVVTSSEKALFKRILEMEIHTYPKDEIYSSGYVLSTLEASFWCFLTTKHYTEAVLTAVNLGEDTDTTACVTGGLAGLYYGEKSIPKAWIEALAQKTQIAKLAEDLALAYPESLVSD